MCVYMSVCVLYRNPNRWTDLEGQCPAITTYLSHHAKNTFHYSF